MKGIKYDVETLHCEGKECKNKQKCLRYKMHEIKKKIKFKDAVLISYVSDEFQCICNNYEHFKVLMNNEL